MSVSVLLEEVAGPQRPFDVELDVERRGEGPEPVCRRNPGILYGLGNLVENAVDFARERVRIVARWDPGQVEVSISDDGPGFPAEILHRLGEPYVTTRGGGGRAKSETGSGMGLGLFIAKTLLERSGAVLALSNAAAGLDRRGRHGDMAAAGLRAWRGTQAGHAGVRIGLISRPTVNQRRTSDVSAWRSEDVGQCIHLRRPSRRLLPRPVPSDRR